MQVFQSMLMASVALVAATTLQANITGTETEVTVQEDVLIYTGPHQPRCQYPCSCLVEAVPASTDPENHQSRW